MAFLQTLQNILVNGSQIPKMERTNPVAFQQNIYSNNSLTEGFKGFKTAKFEFNCTVGKKHPVAVFSCFKG